MKYPTYTERYFPPLGNTAWATRDDAAAHTWFPWHLLTASLGQCSRSDCTQPTAYVLAASGSPEVPMSGLTTACIPICDEHVCDLAQAVNEHTQCPKCQWAWTEDAPDNAKASGPAAIVPDEVKRLRLEPGDKLIVRVSDAWHPRQIREYQDYLQHAVPDNQVLVLPGEQILTAGLGEPDTGGAPQQDGEPLGILTIEWPTSDRRYPVISPVELVVRDAVTGESLAGLTRLRIDMEQGKELIATATEILGESGNPIRQNSREREAETDDGTGVKTITRRYVLARRLLTDGDYASETATTAAE